MTTAIAHQRQYNRDKVIDAPQTAPALHRQWVPWRPQRDEERDDAPT